MPLTKDAINYEHTPKKFLAIPMLQTPWGPSRGKENRIRQAFLDVNMAYQHDSLTNIAIKAGISPLDLKRGDFLLFVNATWTKAKLLGVNGLLIYLKAPRCSRISPTFLLEIPRLFNSHEPLIYDQALVPLMEKFLVRKTREVKPLRGEKKQAKNKNPQVVIVRKKDETKRIEL